MLITINFYYLHFTIFKNFHLKMLHYYQLLLLLFNSINVEIVRFNVNVFLCKILSKFIDRVDWGGMKYFVFFL